MLVCWLFFNFATSFDFGHCSLAHEMSLWTTICPISGSGLSPTHRQPFYLSSLCLLNICVEISSLPSPLLQCGQGTLPSLLCVPFLFLVHYSCFFFFFLQGNGLSVQGAMLVYTMGSCGNTICNLFTHLLICVSQAGLEPVSGSMGTLLCSQCHMVWRSFVQAGGSGCQSFDSSWCFFFYQVCLYCLSKIFDLQSSCCLLLPSSCHLVSSSSDFF
jgi:hypothetical protein